jgi:hypothetical protein
MVTIAFTNMEQMVRGDVPWFLLAVVGVGALLWALLKIRGIK